MGLSPAAVAQSRGRLPSGEAAARQRAQRRELGRLLLPEIEVQRKAARPAVRSLRVGCFSKRWHNQVFITVQFEAMEAKKAAKIGELKCIIWLLEGLGSQNGNLGSIVFKRTS
jgi:hypothetical protein